MLLQLRCRSTTLQQDIVNEATRNMEQQPVDLLQGTVPEFRRVAVQGTYDHSRAAFVGPRPLRWAVFVLRYDNYYVAAAATAVAVH
jgi:cytochrome oxidase assembly protein ShyY1